jgi:hypothetical protein
MAFARRLASRSSLELKVRLGRRPVAMHGLHAAPLRGFATVLRTRCGTARCGETGGRWSGRCDPAQLVIFSYSAAQSSRRAPRESATANCARLPVSDTAYIDPEPYRPFLSTA